jgi:hypothetical protein
MPNRRALGQAFANGGGRNVQSRDFELANPCSGALVFAGKSIGGEIEIVANTFGQPF